MEQQIESEAKEMSSKQEAFMWRILSSSWILKSERDEVCENIEKNNLSTSKASAIICYAIGLQRYRSSFYKKNRKSKAKCHMCGNRFFLKGYSKLDDRSYYWMCSACL